MPCESVHARLYSCASVTKLPRSENQRQHGSQFLFAGRGIVLIHCTRTHISARLEQAPTGSSRSPSAGCSRSHVVRPASRLRVLVSRARDGVPGTPGTHQMPLPPPVCTRARCLSDTGS